MYLFASFYQSSNTKVYHGELTSIVGLKKMGQKTEKKVDKE